MMLQKGIETICIVSFLFIHKQVKQKDHTSSFTAFILVSHSLTHMAVFIIFGNKVVVSSNCRQYKNKQECFGSMPEKKINHKTFYNIVLLNDKLMKNKSAKS